jgi:acyl-CoA thioesterase-1
MHLHHAVLIAVLVTGLWAVLPAADPVTIMPLGDSITQGNKAQDSYRRPLFHKLKDAGYAFTFVGSEKSNFTGPPPHPDFQQDNEGHYGWKITDVLPKLDGWLEKNNPDIVLLHLGTNDNGVPNHKADDILADLEKVIDVLRKHNPKVKVLLAQLMTAWGELVEVNKRIPDLAKRKTTAASPIIVVDQATGFDVRKDKDTVDGCHPNASGEEKMATRWFEALVTVLGKPSARR